VDLEKYPQKRGNTETQKEYLDWIKKFIEKWNEDYDPEFLGNLNGAFDEVSEEEGYGEIDDADNNPAFADLRAFRDELKKFFDDIAIELVPEWALANDVRKINTDDLKRWMGQIESAAEGVENAADQVEDNDKSDAQKGIDALKKAMENLLNALWKVKLEIWQKLPSEVPRTLPDGVRFPTDPELAKKVKEAVTSPTAQPQK